jgi:hypothetical protein
VHNFLHSARDGRDACCLAVETLNAKRNAASHRGKIKIGDVAETRILSALMRCAENLARKRANRIIFRAMSRSFALSAARTALGGGVYTQN